MKNYRPDIVSYGEFCLREHIVPFHQRSYVWDTDKLSDFLSDLKFVFENDTENNQVSHFLGSVITNIQQDTSYIIDGQQRITTFVIFQTAIYSYGCELLKEIDIPQKNPHMTDDEWFEHKKNIKEIKNALWQQIKVIFRVNTAEKYELAVTPSYRDRTAYNELIDIISQNSVGNIDFHHFEEVSYSDTVASKIKESYDYVLKEVKSEFENIEHTKIQETIGKLIALMTHLSNDFEFINVKIFSGDPTKIFNNLNTRGEPLSSLDIIKNFIFSDVESSEISPEEINKRWLKLETKLLKPLKRENFDSGSGVAEAQAKHIDKYWFPLTTALTNSNVSPKHLVEILGNQLSTIMKEEHPNKSKKDQTFEKIKLLEKFAYLYNFLTFDHRDEEAEDLPEEIKEELFTFYRMDCPTMVFHYIFQAVDYYLNLPNDRDSEKKDIIKSFKEIQNRMMRDAFSKAPSQAPKDIYLGLFKQIKNHNYNFKLIRNFLETKSYPYPTDEELKDNFLNEDLYNTKKLRFFLEELEVDKSEMTKSQKRDFFKLQYGTRGERTYEIDHLMPQNNSKWQETLKNEFSKKEYEKLVQRIGNCFLLEKTLNIRKSNKNLREAQDIISSSISRNYYVLTISELSEWNDLTIKQQSEKYFNYFSKKWAFEERIEVPDENEVEEIALAKADVKYSPLAEGNNIKPYYFFVSNNKYDRDDFNLSNLKTLLNDELGIELSERKDKNPISLKFILSNGVVSQRKMNVYNARRNTINRGPEFLFSIQKHKELMVAGDVLLFFSKNGELYCINTSAPQLVEFKRLVGRL
tara:strand:+ start:1246 stop:3657 length:2412 start_codon:yes stop_codon:yes gene_type:complete